MGPPIFVPSGRWSPLWRVSGRGSNRGIVSNVHVSARANYQEHLTVRTFSGLLERPREGLHDAGLVAMVLGQSVPHDVRLPFTSTVEEIQLPISIGETEVVEFRCFSAPSNWIAIGAIDERWVEIHAIGIEFDGMELERISDVEGIPDNRF